ncbi:MAG: threonine--tRNA ligase [Alphaproteobacteria bacterium]|nr:threonine--tRNA ligase [Alphaproteobacteria bacterium]
MAQAAAQTKDITLTLPDGTARTYPAGTTGEEVAASIGAGLAKAAVAMKVDGVQRDLYLPITHDAAFQILTAKDAEGIDVIRHTITAQTLALAVKELYPSAKLAIGPTIEHGFYYDVELETPLVPDDLPKIEARMREILKRGHAVKREMWEKQKAIALFTSRGESYKAEIIQGAPDGEVSLYRQGEGDNAFIDLCFGPHVPHFNKITAAFALTKISGAYWRGDSKNKMLQRIYGIAFANDKELKAHLTMLEEAEKRDHRKLGKELDLFHIQEEAVGQVFWHDKGWTIYRELENYIRRKLQRNGYIEVKTPILVERTLWEMSGHWEKFKENMFISESEDKHLAIKPMNCPCHVQIFNVGLKSYRDLPIRMAEFGNCHRNEPSGALHGLMRVRGFVQDDAHIFCTEDQITQETIRFCDLLKEVYRDLGFTEVRVKFSDRPEKRAGTDATWDKAEGALKDAVTAAGLEYTLNPGEGAFYGPKLEFVLRDAIGRDWQCGTLQVDFVLPERLNAHYIGEDGNKHRPVMLHRAILGSFERFIGILIEQYAGKFPLWMTPTHAVVCPITNEFDAYANEVTSALRAAGIRAESDLSNNKITYKVREHSLQKVPFIIAVGGRDRDAGTVAIRRLGSESQETLALSAAIATLSTEIQPPA